MLTDSIERKREGEKGERERGRVRRGERERRERERETSINCLLYLPLPGIKLATCWYTE